MEVEIWHMVVGYFILGWAITELALKAAKKHFDYDKQPYSEGTRVATYFLSIFFWPLMVFYAIFGKDKK